MTKELLDSFVQISTNLKKFIEDNELYIYHPVYGDEDEICEGFLKYIKKNIANKEYLLVLYPNNNKPFVFGDKKEIETLIDNHVNDVIIYRNIHHEMSIFIYNIKEDKEVNWKVTIDD